MEDQFRDDFIETMKQAGHSQEEIEEILNELAIIRKGRTWGYAHLEDISQIVYKALDWLQNTSITLKISKEGGENYDGHLRIEVIDIQKGE